MPSRLDRAPALALRDGPQGVPRLTGPREEAAQARRGGAIERADPLAAGTPAGVLVLYTGGITEAEDTHGEQYGVERPCGAVGRTHERGPAEQAIARHVTRSIGVQEVFDDITTVVIRRR